MKILFFAALIFFAFANQLKAQNTVKVEVIKFNWSMYDLKKEMDDSTRLETGIFKRPSRSNPTGEKSVEERSRDLSRAERGAMREASSPSGNIFLYELKIKNLDEKTIKSFIWEYQASKENNPQILFTRRFLCVEKIKAGNSKMLKIISHLPPVNVLDVSASNDKSERSYAVDIVINRVEYTDGTIWKRADWDDSKYALDLPEIAEKLKFNDCAAL